MTKTINISLSETDLERIDKYCLAHSLTRSKFMLQATIQALEVEEMANATRLLYHCMEEFRRDGKMDSYDESQMERLENMLRGFGMNV